MPSVDQQRLGGLTTQIRYGDAVAARARRGLRAKFEREADPDGVLSEAARSKRADQLMRAHMARMRLAAAAKRAATNGGGSTPPT